MADLPNPDLMPPYVLPQSTADALRVLAEIMNESWTDEPDRVRAADRILAHASRRTAQTGPSNEPSLEWWHDLKVA